MSTLERLQKLEESMSMVVAKITQPDPMLQMVMNKTVGIEQSVAAMGKTLSAVTEELSETKVLNSMNVMVRLRKAEDESGRLNVKSLLSESIIEKDTKVNANSLVVVSQKIINTETGETTVLSEYNLIGINSPITNQVWKDALMTKEVGNSVKGIGAPNEEELLTIVEIYSIKERNVEGESEEELNLSEVTDEELVGLPDDQEIQDESIGE